MGRAVQEVVNRRGHQLAATQAQQAGTLQEAQKWLGIDQNASHQTPVRQLKIGGLVGGEVDAEPLGPDGARGQRHVRFAEAPSEAPKSEMQAGARAFISNLKRGGGPGDVAIVRHMEEISGSLKRIADSLAQLVGERGAPEPKTQESAPAGGIESDSSSSAESPNPE
mgnify:CR=1 FL=1